jgi:hypothetical protein
MKTQNYVNHRRYVPMYHGVLSFLLLITFIGSLVNTYLSIGDHQRIYSASLITVLTFCGLIQLWYSRAFAVKVQDRAIRAEENLRHFVMSGKLFDAKLKMGQIIALRFASDEEYLPLVKRANEENLSRDDIKKAIKNWRADNHRA